MKTPDEWASDLDDMYKTAHPSAEKFIKYLIKSTYKDAINCIENEHMYDDGLIEVLNDRMQELLGEEEQ